MRYRLQFVLLIAAAVVVATGSSFRKAAAEGSLGRIFSHNTRAHKTGKYSNCSSCHSLPTRNWTTPRRDKLPAFPDVRTFPSHTSCFGCHTKDIYSAGGAFCGTCHVVPTMRARAVLAFPIRSHPSQFTTLFPHSTHQDLIAEKRNDMDFLAAHFIPAAFVVSDEKPKVPTFYNCSICHQNLAQIPKNVPRKLTLFKPLSEAAADTFRRPVTAEFFKDSPDGHESCFNCHYQFKNLPEEKKGCNACHELSPPYLEKKVIQRYSLKFDHQRPGHVEKDCTACHLRITQNKDVRAMKDADVPILSCKACHATQEDDEWKHILTTEIEKRETSIANKQPAFQCTYCHTSAIGRYEIPPSHR